jgi:hypothetical protein
MKIYKCRLVRNYTFLFIFLQSIQHNQHCQYDVVSLGVYYYGVKIIIFDAIVKTLQDVILRGNLPYHDKYVSNSQTNNDPTLHRPIDHLFIIHSSDNSVSPSNLIPLFFSLLPQLKILPFLSATTTPINTNQTHATIT